MVPWWRSFSFRFVGLYSAVSLVLILSAVAWIDRLQRQEVSGKFGLALESIAGTAAPFFTGEDLDAITTNAHARGEIFQRVRSLLERVRKENGLEPDNVYILRKSMATDGHYEFVVMLQEKTFVGDTYQPPPEVQTLYGWVETKTDTVRTELYEDVHGTFISGIAPILRRDGSIAGLLQVDYGLGTYMHEVEIRREVLLIGTAILVVLFFLAGLWMHRSLRTNVGLLLGGTNAIQQEDYDHIVFLKTRDELGSVAEALNQALRKLKERFEMLKFLPRHTARMIEAATKGGGGGVQRAHAIRVRVVVFESDIRGFSKISEAMEPEAIVRMLNEYIRVQAEIIETAGGSIDKFMGDAVLSIFEGENMERRALESAIAIQDAVARMNTAGVFDVPVNIGIGITVGELVMGNMGSDRRMEHTVIGSTVNLAARLCSAAGAGEIVVSDDLSRGLGDSSGFMLGAPEEVTVKGFARPIRCFRVLSRPITTSPSTAAATPGRS